jgi:hypothetical protein
MLDLTLMTNVLKYNQIGSLAPDNEKTPVISSEKLCGGTSWLKFLYRTK